MRQLSEWAKANRAGFLILAMVTAMVAGVWAHAKMQRTKAWKMADELASVVSFWGLPKPNHANTQFVFCRRTFAGLAVMKHEGAGRDEMIFERAENSLNLNYFRPLDWSPDDKYCAYACDGHAFIRDNNTEQTVGDINLGGGLANFVWLTPSTIAAFNSFSLYLITHEQKHWNKTLLCTVTNAASLNTLTRLSDQSIAWRQDNDIWVCDIADKVPKKITDDTMGLVEGFSLNDDGSLLVNCDAFSSDTNNIDRHAGELFRYSPTTAKSPWVHLGKIGRPEDFVYKASFINQGNGYAYMTSHSYERDIRPPMANKNVTLHLKPSAQSEPVLILAEREAVDFVVNGTHLYAQGSLSNEPCSLWDYDIRSGKLTCACPGLPDAKTLTFVMPEYLTTTNAVGQPVHYYLWAPKHMAAGKKYPLMIGQSSYRWMMEAQLAANSGFYFALAERATWYSDRIDSWAADVQSVRASLVGDRNIDAERVFLTSVSVEGAYLSKVMEDVPTLWKGAFLQGWHGPEGMGGKPAQIEMIIGDHDEQNRLSDVQKYQENTAKNGINTKIILRPGQHTAVAQDPLNRTGRQLAEFYLENQ